MEPRIGTGDFVRGVAVFDPSRLVTKSLAPVAAGAAVLATSLATLPTICPFRLCSGQACPGCGLTRGTVAALRGDVGLSVRYHPLAIAIGLQLAVAWVVWAFVSRSKRTTLARYAVPVVALNAAALIVTWAIRWRLGLLEFVL